MREKGWMGEKDGEGLNSEYKEYIFVLFWAIFLKCEITSKFKK